MYVSEICAEGFFCNFSWWLENVKSRSKIALFLNERHFEIWFPKKRTITFFWCKLSKLHKKDTILHVATTFSLKQGETSTRHGPILHPSKSFFGYHQSEFSCLTPVEPKVWALTFSSITTKRYFVDRSNYTVSESLWQEKSVGMVFDNIEATFEIDPCTNYPVIPRISLQDVSRQQYKIVILGPIQHNKIINLLFVFQMIKFLLASGLMMFWAQLNTLWIL